MDSRVVMGCGKDVKARVKDACCLQVVTPFPVSPGIQEPDGSAEVLQAQKRMSMWPEAGYSPSCHLR